MTCVPNSLVSLCCWPLRHVCLYIRTFNLCAVWPCEFSLICGNHLLVSWPGIPFFFYWHDVSSLTKHLDSFANTLQDKWVPFESFTARWCSKHDSNFHWLFLWHTQSGVQSYFSCRAESTTGARLRSDVPDLCGEQVNNIPMLPNLRCLSIGWQCWCLCLIGSIERSQQWLQKWPSHPRLHEYGKTWLPPHHC